MTIHNKMIQNSTITSIHIMHVRLTYLFVIKSDHSIFLQNIFMEFEMRHDGNNKNKTKMNK